MPLDVSFEWFARDTLNDVARKVGAIIGVCRNASRSSHTRRHPALKFFSQRMQLARIIDEQQTSYLIEARAVSHEIVQSDRGALARRDLEIEVGVNVRIEVEFALLDQLHHSRPGKQFGHRPWSEQGTFGVDRLALAYIRIPITLL